MTFDESLTIDDYKKMLRDEKRQYHSMWRRHAALMVLYIVCYFSCGIVAAAGMVYIINTASTMLIIAVLVCPISLLLVLLTRKSRFIQTEYRAMVLKSSDTIQKLEYIIGKLKEKGHLTLSDISTLELRWTPMS